MERQNEKQENGRTEKEREREKSKKEREISPMKQCLVENLPIDRTPPEKDQETPDSNRIVQHVCCGSMFS